MDPNNLDPNDMEELQKQLAAVLPGQDALSGMSTADQAQFTEALLGSMGSTFEGMFSGKGVQYFLEVSDKMQLTTQHQHNIYPCLAYSCISII